MHSPAIILTLGSGPHAGPGLALQLLILLATAAAVATIFRRLRLELIPGYLLAGVIVGPRALGLVSDSGAVESTSELAVILLMFGIGMHLDVGAMRRGLVHILMVGGGSTLAVSLVVFGVLMFFTSPPAAVVLGMAMGLSSTAVLVRILGARREARSLHGRVWLGVAIVQDLVSVLVMALLPPIARWAGVEFQGASGLVSSGLPRWAQFLTAAGVAAGGITVMLLGGRVLLPRLLGLVSRVGSSELVLVVSAAVALGAAIGTAGLGFSPEMGAFLAGFLLASTPYRYQLAGQLAPMRDLLMAVFFTAVGMRVDPGVIASHAVVVVGSGLLLVLVKALIIGGSGWLAGMSAPSSLLTGAYLNNAGEFSLVIITAAGAMQILSPDQQGTAIAVIIVSLIVSPLLITPAHWLSARLTGVRLAPWGRGSALRDARSASPDRHPSAGANGEEAAPADLPPPAPRVVIAGFGPVGRALADRLSLRRVEFTVIELNPRTVERHLAFGRKFVYGDVTNPEVLEQAGIEHADAVIITIPDEETTLRAVRAVRAMAPETFLAVRTNFLSGKFIALQLGANLVTVEEVATAQAMEREVLDALAKVLPNPAEKTASPG